MKTKWTKRRIIAAGVGAFLLASLLTLQFIPQQYVYRVMRHCNLLVPSAHGTDITNLVGLTGNVGKEDIEWGTGLATDTFTVPSSTSGTVTLTKVPSLFANIASIIKGKWYVTTDTVANQADNSIKGSLAWIVTQLAGSKATIELTPATYTFAGNYTFPATVALDSQFGSTIVATGRVVTINGPWICGRWKAFTAVTGEIVFGVGAVDVLYPEQWGAVADGDGVTNDAAAMQACLTAAPFGSTIRLHSNTTNGYWIGTTMLDISDATSRELTVEGVATIFSSTTGASPNIAAFRVMSRSTTLKDFTIQASAGSERVNNSQIGLLIANQTGSLYDHISVKNFYTNYKLFVYSAGQQPTWLETTKFFACYSQNGHYGFWIGTDKAKWQSFATLHFYGCAVDIDFTETNGVGVYIGPHVDLYRGYMDMSVHAKAQDSRGFYYEGDTHGFTGRWAGECHQGNPLATGLTGQTMIYMGTNARRLDGEIEVDVMGCHVPFAREDAGTIWPNAFYTMTNNGKAFLTWEGKSASPWTIEGAEFATILTGYVTGATSVGDQTEITCGTAPGFHVGDHAVIHAILDTNPFYALLEWTSFTVTAVSTDGLTITINVDTSTVAGTWTSGDVANLRKSTIKMRMGVTALDYVQFLAPGGRFSFLQLNNDNYNQNVAMVPVLTCCYSSVIGPNDTTLDVSGCPCVILDNTSPIIITDFIGTTFGNAMNRTLVVHHANANTGIKYDNGNGKIKTLQQQDVVGQTGMTQIFQIIDPDPADPGVFQWWEISRSYNVHIKNVWANVPANPQVGQQFLCTDCECGATTLTYPLTFDGTAWRCGNGIATPNTP